MENIDLADYVGKAPACKVFLAPNLTRCEVLQTIRRLSQQKKSLQSPFTLTVRHLVQVVEASKNAAGFSGFCTHCGNAATKAAHFDEDRVTIIEKYCDACSAPENFERLQEW